MIVASIGLGATIGAILLLMRDTDFIPLLAVTLVLFLVGLGVMINGLWFTVPRKQIPQPDLNNLHYEPPDVTQRPTTQNITPPYQALPSSSVTEHTTHHLTSGNQK